MVALVGERLDVDGDVAQRIRYEQTAVVGDTAANRLFGGARYIPRTRAVIQAHRVPPLPNESVSWGYGSRGVSDRAVRMLFYAPDTSFATQDVFRLETNGPPIAPILPRARKA